MSEIKEIKETNNQQVKEISNLIDVIIIIDKDEVIRIALPKSDKKTNYPYSNNFNDEKYYYYMELISNPKAIVEKHKTSTDIFIPKLESLTKIKDETLLLFSLFKNLTSNSLSQFLNQTTTLNLAKALSFFIDLNLLSVIKAIVDYIFDLFQREIDNKKFEKIIDSNKKETHYHIFQQLVNNYNILQSKINEERNCFSVFNIREKQLNEIHESMSKMIFLLLDNQDKEELDSYIQVIKNMFFSVYNIYYNQNHKYLVSENSYCFLIKFTKIFTYSLLNNSVLSVDDKINLIMKYCLKFEKEIEIITTNKEKMVLNSLITNIIIDYNNKIGRNELAYYYCLLKEKANINPTVFFNSLKGVVGVIKDNFKEDADEGYERDSNLTYSMIIDNNSFYNLNMSEYNYYYNNLKSKDLVINEMKEDLVSKDNKIKDISEMNQTLKDELDKKNIYISFANDVVNSKEVIEKIKQSDNFKNIDFSELEKEINSRLVVI